MDTGPTVGTQAKTIGFVYSDVVRMQLVEWCVALCTTFGTCLGIPGPFVDCACSSGAHASCVLAILCAVQATLYQALSRSSCPCCWSARWAQATAAAAQAAAASSCARRCARPSLRLMKIWQPAPLIASSVGARAQSHTCRCAVDGKHSPHSSSSLYHNRGSCTLPALYCAPKQNRPECGLAEAGCCLGTKWLAQAEVQREPRRKLSLYVALLLLAGPHADHSMGW